MKFFFLNQIQKQLLKDNSKDYRILVLLALVAYFSLIILSYYLIPDYPKIWKGMGWQVMANSFHDLRVITSGLDCYRNGVDPLIDGHCKPSEFTWNYPRIWYIFSYLGITEAHTFFIGILVTCLFFLSVLLFVIGKVNLVEGVFYSLILCSPPIMLGVERGNNDLIVFVLLTSALLILKRNTSVKYFSYSLIFAGGLFKFHPIFAMVVSLREKPKVFFILCGVFFIAFTAYLLTIREDLVLVSKTTPRFWESSHGIFVFVDGLKDQLQKVNGLLLQGHLWAIVFVAILLAINYIIINKRVDLKLDHTFIDSFRIGAGVFIGAFLLGNNFDYRFIFLIFTLPQVLQWAKGNNAFSKFSILVLLIIIVSFWHHYFFKIITFFPKGSLMKFTLKEVLNWAIFAYFLYSVIQTLPDWLKEIIWNKKAMNR